MDIVFEFPTVPQFDFLVDLQGASLYQKWLELGNTGDHADFLDWLKIKGDTGLLYIKSNESLSLAQRKGDVLYGIIDQYTGEQITLSKVTGTPTVDGIIYFQLASEYFKRNFTEINVDCFGCVGNGIADDTVNIQKALTTDSKIINFTQGKTYLTDGLTSSVTNRTINVNGATIKLKNNASIKSMLKITGQYTEVIGGTWNGNKSNGNSVNTAPDYGYDSCNVLIDANNCTVRNIISVNTYGMAIKGASTVSYLLAENNNIKDVELYGIFIDGNNINIMQYGNKAIGNTIDCSFNPAFTQGILFTSALTPTCFQTDFEVSGNKIYGSLIASNEWNICIAVRGNKGIFSNNITVGGAMGISEGGNDTIYSNNNISKLSSNGIGYGIEIAGSNVTVSNNVIKNAKYGVIGSNLINYDNCIISSNIIEGTTSPITFLIQPTFSGHNIVVTGNKTYGNSISFSKNIDNLFISNNNIVGLGSGVDFRNGVILDTPNSVAKVSIIGNKISGFFGAFSVYSATSIEFSKLYATNNDISDDILVGSNGWRVEGLATIGIGVVSSYNILKDNEVKNILDQKNNIFIWYNDTYNNPNTYLNAGVGSFYYSKNHNGGAYFKFSGTGNTGWIPIHKDFNTMLSQAASTASTVADVVTDLNALITKLKTAGLMTT